MQANIAMTRATTCQRERREIQTIVSSSCCKRNNRFRFRTFSFGFLYTSNSTNIPFNNIHYSRDTTSMMIMMMMMMPTNQNLQQHSRLLDQYPNPQFPNMPSPRNRIILQHCCSYYHYCYLVMMVMMIGMKFWRATWRFFPPYFD